LDTINIINLGCSKNLVDSEHLARQLKANGYSIVFDQTEYYPITLINTCGFIHDAQQESIDTILEIAEQNKNNPNAFLGVFGCLTTLFAKELEKEIPEVNAWFGKFDTNEIIEALNGKVKYNLSHERIISTPSHYAYLKISEGCHRKCAFCSIPKITGNFKSVETEELIKEAQFLANSGVKELILIAQDLTYYGQDLPNKPTLTQLVKNISKIEGIEWIRLQYAYPVGIPDDLFEEMNDNPKVCKYIDIPVQHISDDILSGMRRGHNNASTQNILNNIRKKVSDVEIRTTLIVGFPGETDDHFQELLSFVEGFKFEKMGAFPYSHEAYTYAYENLNDNVDEDLKQERLDVLMEVQESISFQHNQNKIGKTLKVIIDRIEDGTYYGRTEFDSPDVDGEVIINSDKKLEIGHFYNIKITDAEPFDLFGEV
jgi:ribosomal protein S12 methylthiotransferase